MKGARLLGARDSVVQLPPDQDVVMGRGTHGIPPTDKRCSRHSLTVRFDSTANTVKVSQVRHALIIASLTAQCIPNILIYPLDLEKPWYLVQGDAKRTIYEGRRLGMDFSRFYACNFISIYS